MALETLKRIEKIGGFEVKRVEWEQQDQNFIEVNDSANAITFKIQNGPIKENGVNGCQVDTMIETTKIIIEKLNERFPCKENETCIYHLSKALQALKDRKKDREARKVEGFNKK